MTGGGGGETQQQHMVPISQLWSGGVAADAGAGTGLQSGDINTPVIVTFTSTSRKLQFHADRALLHMYSSVQFCTHTPTFNQLS